MTEKMAKLVFKVSVPEGQIDQVSKKVVDVCKAEGVQLELSDIKRDSGMETFIRRQNLLMDILKTGEEFGANVPELLRKAVWGSRIADVVMNQYAEFKVGHPITGAFEVAEKLSWDVQPTSIKAAYHKALINVQYHLREMGCPGFDKYKE